MRWQCALVLASALTGFALAGCLSEENVVPDRYEVSASGGQASDGYAYDGTGLVDAGASLSGWLDHTSNTGRIETSFDFAGSTWTVVHDNFSGQEEWKEGGVSFGLVEHGDTGISTPIIPRIDGRVVTYGTAQVLRDGEPAGDRAGSDGPWMAHLMLSSSTIRDADGTITKGDGTTPYDPATPEDARIIEDDPQAFLQLTAPGGADSARADAVVNDSVEIAGPDDTQSAPLGDATGGTLTVNITTTDTSTVPVQAGEVTLRLVDADGNELDSATGNVMPNQPYTTSLQATGANGTVTLEVSGTGAYSVAYQARTAYDDHPFIILTWDDYTLDAADAA